jgi:PAS domain S-box-containing protein
MSAAKKFSSSPENLYRRAEELLSTQPADYTVSKNIKELVHDLHVHQIELTIQNEELIQTQSELKQAYDAYHELYDFAPIGYLTVSSEGDITNANLMAGGMFDIGSSSLIGRKITSFIYNDDQDIYYFHNQLLLASRDRQCCELRLTRNDGQVFHARLDSISYPVKNQNKLMYRIAITDITEKKNMETELREALDKAEGANMAKSEFLANMSHEIRTPLNAIVGIINILRVRDYSKERQALYMHTLDDSAKALLELINDILDFAKIESRMLDLEIKPFNLYEVAQESLHIVEVKAEEKKLRLAFDYPKGMHKTFLGDGLRIRQILLNLLNNAIKFTETGSVTLKVEMEPRGVRISIVDTGIGIPPDKQECIFNKFTQEDASTTRKYGGTGLGLSICRELVWLMDGNIEIESQPGKGSVFTLHLPLEPVANVSIEDNSQKPSDISEQESDHRDIKILLVEDYKANILVATHLLEAFGYDYEVARNSYEALLKLKQGDFSLILMDIQMEGRDGMETTRIIRELEKKQGSPRIPIIAMTAYALTGDKEKFLRAGMDGYISKPVNAEELEKILTHFAKRCVNASEHQ